MLVTARITKNAEVKTLPSGKEVTEFSVAVNDYYKSKDGEAKQFTLFLNCSYWFSPKVAPRLTKGTLVEMTGRISVNPYLNKEGEPKASLNFYANSIKIHSSGSAIAVDADGKLQPTGTAEKIKEAADDLPF